MFISSVDLPPAELYLPVSHSYIRHQQTSCNMNTYRYSTRPNEMGINSNIKLIENLKLSGIKRRKSFTKTKDGRFSDILNVF